MLASTGEWSAIDTPPSELVLNSTHPRLLVTNLVWISHRMINATECSGNPNNQTQWWNFISDNSAKAATNNRQRWNEIEIVSLSRANRDCVTLTYLWWFLMLVADPCAAGARILRRPGPRRHLTCSHTERHPWTGKSRRIRSSSKQIGFFFSFLMFQIVPRAEQNIW